MEINGVITEEENGSPIQDVAVSTFILGQKEKIKRSHDQSDSLGKFIVVTDLYGCGCGDCPDPYIILEKSGYVAETLKVKTHTVNKMAMKKQ